MKKLFKLLSVFALLISGFSFAQYSPGGCIPTPPPLDKLIPKPISTDQDWFSLERATDMSNYLVAVNKSIDSGKTSDEFRTKYERQYTSDENYKWAQLVISETNGDVNKLIELTNEKLLNSKTEKDKAFYVLFIYQMEMLQSKGLLSQEVSVTARPCTPKEKLELLAAGATVGSFIEPGIGTAVGMLVGVIIGSAGGC